MKIVVADTPFKKIRIRIFKISQAETSHNVLKLLIIDSSSSTNNDSLQDLHISLCNPSNFTHQ